MLGDREVLRHLDGTRLPRLAPGLAAAREIRGFHRSWSRQGVGMWAVEPRQTGALFGRVGLSRHRDGTVEIGWLLAREQWGRGYATEAASAALDFAFGPLGLDRVASYTAVANERSIAVMSRLGFEPAETQGGTMRYALTADGHRALRRVARSREQPARRSSA